MAGSILVLSGEDVASLTQSISAESLCRMVGKTMHYISADTKHPHDSSKGAAPIQNPPRIATESELHKTLFMPSRLTTVPGEPSATAVKVVAVPKPICSVPGLPATTLLFDESSGKCRAVVNADELTGLRTAAASALATLLLASPTSKNLVIFGSGTQAYHHARLIIHLFPSITTTTFIVRQMNERAIGMVERLREEFGTLKIDAVTSECTSELVSQADIICGCVPSTEPVFDASDLKETVHINAIGSYTPKMKEFPPSLISPSTLSDNPTASHIPIILVDSRSACLSEAGELIEAGILPGACVEIGEVVDSEGQALPGGDGVDGRGLRKGGRSLFKCVGVGGMDVAITELVVRAAEERGVGCRVAF